MKWLPITLLLIVALPVSAVLYVRQAPDVKQVPGVAESFSTIQIPAGENTKVAAVTSQSELQNERIPDFSAYYDVQQKKRTFFDFMLPLIREANASIRNERSQLIAFFHRLESGMVLSGGEYQRLSQLFSRYRFNMPLKVEAQNVDELLKRMDIVPASLVLAQSANESGWGTSRFAIEANNYFGIWCFSAGCGIEPNERTDGLTHEVAAYSSVQESVAAYMHNINTNNAYEVLRIIRAEQRTLQNNFMGMQLAHGLQHYSERGQDYVREIQAMIRTNKLHVYTLASSFLPTKV